MPSAANLRQSTQLAAAQNRARRGGSSGIKSGLDSKQPLADSQRGAMVNRENGARDNQDMKQQALRLAKSAATGRRDKSKSLVSQGIGEAGARGGQVLGGIIGTAVPVVGNAVGSIIGKRIGRIAGENWKITILAIMGGIFLSILPFLFTIFFLAVIVIAILQVFGML